MIEDLLPDGVAVAEMFTDSGGEPLFPEEHELIAAAVDKRRIEFTGGRTCARRALAQLGAGPVPILRGEGGAPVWPAGYVGSITHCAGYRAAAAARTGEFETVGIDAEPDGGLPDGVLGIVSLPEEREMLDRLPAGTYWDKLLFCAKEAVYKAWFPITGAWLGFQDASVTLHEGGHFTARILIPAQVSGFEGGWLNRDGLIATAIAVPAGGAAGSGDRA